MSHPSEEWIEEIAASASPALLQLARHRHSEISNRFQRRAELDGTGFLQALIEIEGETGLYPGSPPTLRGKIGKWMIRIQGRALWWLLNSMRTRDRALRCAYDLVCGQIEASALSQRTMAGEILELRRRIEELDRNIAASRRMAANESRLASAVGGDA